jgi:hypothetical protein
MKGSQLTVFQCNINTKTNCELKLFYNYETPILLQWTEMWYEMHSSKLEGMKEKNRKWWRRGMGRRKITKLKMGNKNKAWDKNSGRGGECVCVWVGGGARAHVYADTLTHTYIYTWTYMSVQTIRHQLKLAIRRNERNCSVIFKPAKWWEKALWT